MFGIESLSSGLSCVTKCRLLVMAVPWGVLYSACMSRFVQLSRRSFVIMVAAVIPATKAVALEKLFPSTENPLAQATKTYMCPPCGLECDKLVFDKPGACPTCGMTLINNVESTQTAATRVRLPNNKPSVQF